MATKQFFVPKMLKQFLYILRVTSKNVPGKLLYLQKCLQLMVKNVIVYWIRSRCCDTFDSENILLQSSSAVCRLSSILVHIHFLRVFAEIWVYTNFRVSCKKDLNFSVQVSLKIFYTISWAKKTVDLQGGVSNHLMI